MPKWISVEEAAEVWNQQRSNLALGGQEVKIPQAERTPLLMKKPLSGFPIRMGAIEQAEYNAHIGKTYVLKSKYLQLYMLKLLLPRQRTLIKESK